MRFGVILPYAEGAMSREDVEEFARTADELGYHSIWVAEAWSFDAFMLLTSLAPHTKQIQLGTAIVNVFSRTPALIGQSVATLDVLSGGRTILGLGTSGPQVIEGWHGVPFRKPLGRTRETMEIVRTILRRERLNYSGEVFDLQMGLKLINHPVRAEVPMYVASLGPKNVEMTAEIADGWIPTLYSPCKANEVFGPSLEAGRTKRSADLGPLDVMPTITAAVTEHEVAVKTFIRYGLALYVGGMGSRERNFYNTLYRRYGYEQEAKEIQDLYLDRKRDEAAAKVTDEMIDEVSAIGPGGFVKDRVAEFAESGATSLMLQLAAADQKSRLENLEFFASLAG